MRTETIVMAPTPVLRYGLSLPQIMLRVNLCLALPAAGGVLVYGLPALLLLLACITGSILAEFFLKALLGNRQRVLDGSALLSGLILALLLPPGLSPWWALGASFVGFLLTRELFGGIGRNPLNPAVAVRLLFSLALAPQLNAARLLPFWWREGGFFTWPTDAVRLLQPPLEVAGRAAHILEQTLRGQLPAELPSGWQAGDVLSVMHQAQDLLQSWSLLELVWPGHAGMLGATSLVLLLPGLVWLTANRVIDWRIPLPAMGLLLTAAIVCLQTELNTWFWAVLALRGTLLLLLLFFLASDPVSSPLSQRGKLIYSFLLGFALMPFLIFSDQEVAPLLALLLANLLTPWIDRCTQPGGPR